MPSRELGLTMNHDNSIRLREILMTMDLPPARVSSLDRGWLLRNIAVRNQDHPDFAEAVALLKAV